MWEQKDWLLAAVVSIVTLLVSKGWPVAQWLIEFLRKSKVEDKTEEQKNREHSEKLVSEGYEMTIARLDRDNEIKTNKIEKLEAEHQQCLKATARMEQQILNLELESKRQLEQIDVLLAWKRSRGGSDTIKPAS